MQKFQTGILFGIQITLLGLLCSCVRTQKELDSSELLPILNNNNLNASAPHERHKEITEVEEVDSSLYGPYAGKTIFLESRSPTADSEGFKPRYWLRVEDYETAEMALKRASEYEAVGTYDRIEAAFKAKGESVEKNSFILSKTSVRIWAIPRGKRVYALTTDTYIFTLIETPKSLQKAIESLPPT